MVFWVNFWQLAIFLIFKNVIREFVFGAIDCQILKFKKKKCQILHQVQIGSQQ
jgi:hypothetical protein